MSITVFSVTADAVRTAHFPHWTPFAATTKPTATQVATFINEEAADLEGALAMKNIVASQIAVGSAAEASCAKTLKLMVAIRVMRVATAQDPDLAKTWADELTKRLKNISEHGATGLGSGATATTTGSPPQGPTTHISQFSLDTGDASDASDVIPRLRRSDQL